MLEKSLNKSVLKSRIRHIATKYGSAHRTAYPQWNMLLWLPLGVTIAYAFSTLLLILFFNLLSFFGVYAEDFIRPAVFQTLIACITYALTIALVIGAPYLYDKRKPSWKLIGLHRLPTWTDIGLAPASFIAYVLILTVVLSLVSSIFPAIDLEQTQDLGFKAFGSRFDNILAFITLVVVAPVAEEVLFRGYLYGKLKAFVPAIWAAIATSILFAVAHLQINVGIDVFVLSMILCGLRSLTGSIWSGILLHMIKNGIAYYMLFISPLLGG